MKGYKRLGLDNTKEIFARAVKEGFAVPAYNFNDMEMMQGIIEACAETGSPVMLACSTGAIKYMRMPVLINLAKAAVDYARSMNSSIPVVLHLDHGPDFEACKLCIDSGFSSVMIDGSHLSYEENVTVTKKVVDYAHSQNDYVTVEGELGVLAGIEDDVVAEKSSYTKPEEVEDFVSRTNVDSLAISIGTSHGANKFSPEQCNRNEKGVLVPPPLRFDVLAEIEQRLPGFPIVLHGSSTVPMNDVNTIKKYGGTLKDSVGISEDQLVKAAKTAVCKINVDTDGRLAFTSAIRKVFGDKPGEFDPRKYLGAARDNLKELYMSKNKEIFNSAGRY